MPARATAPRRERTASSSPCAAMIRSSTTPPSLMTSPAGVVTAVRRGEAAVLVRYEGSYATNGLLVMGDRTGFRWAEQPANNYVDRLVYQKLRQVKVLPSGLCTDDEFLRRVSLDLIGMPPSPEQVRAFLADRTPARAKREALVDRLIGSPEFVEHWTNKWADLLDCNRKYLGD